jgi:hypothetical protein
MVRLRFFEGRVGIGRDGTAMARAAAFIARNEVLPKSPLLEHTSKSQ